MSRRDDYIAMAKAAHGFSRHAVGYEQLALRFPWRKDRLLMRALKCRQDARWCLEMARRTKDADSEASRKVAA